MGIKYLIENLAFTDVDKDYISEQVIDKIYENYINDLKEFGEDAKEVYALLLGEDGKQIVEAFDEAQPYLTEAEAEGRMMAYKMLADVNKNKKYETPKNSFAAWAGRNLPKNDAPSISDKVRGKSGGGLLSGIWEKIKEFGSKIPAALKGFAEKGMKFFAENPWAGVLAAVSAAGLTYAAAKKIFKKSGRKLTAEQEAELKKKLSAGNAPATAVPAKA